MTVQTFLTFNSLAKRTGIPVGTLSRRIRALGLQPDGITVETTRPSVLLFATDRLPELRLALATDKPATT